MDGVDPAESAEERANGRSVLPVDRNSACKVDDTSVAPV
jgi:hypothetical protein